MFAPRPEITVTSLQVGKQSNIWGTTKPKWKAIAEADSFKYTATGYFSRREAEKAAVEGLRKMMKTRRTRTV